MANGFGKIKNTISTYKQRQLHKRLFQKYAEFTMIPFESFSYNLELCHKYKRVNGCVVECGVWRGGMIAAIAEILGAERKYLLFDSFEGLPKAQEIDGKTALDWQNDKSSPLYFENCKAEIEYAQKAMSISNAKDVEIIKGWFNETLKNANIKEPIAVLRLDGDWYDSTIECMNNLYPKILEGGLVLLDDYAYWDGFSRAIHDYLSKNNLPVRINQWHDSKVHYIIKKS